MCVIIFALMYIHEVRHDTSHQGLQATVCGELCRYSRDDVRKSWMQMVRCKNDAGLRRKAAVALVQGIRIATNVCNPTSVVHDASCFVVASATRPSLH